MHRVTGRSWLDLCVGGDGRVVLVHQCHPDEGPASGTTVQSVGILATLSSLAVIGPFVVEGLLSSADATNAPVDGPGHLDRARADISPGAGSDGASDLLWRAVGRRCRLGCRGGRAHGLVEVG